MIATEPAPGLAIVPSAEAHENTARWNALRAVPLRLSIDTAAHLATGGAGA